MNRISIILSSLALLGVLILGILQFRSPEKPKPAAASKVAVETNLQGSSIAYFNIDTFEANYETLKAKKAEMEAQNKSIQQELERSWGQFQTDYATTQRKAQEGSMSQADMQAAEKRLGTMQQTLKAREQSIGKQLKEKMDAFNKELYDSMNDFLADYAETHKLDYIFTTSESAPVLMYGKPALNITQDVIKGMNERAKANAEAAKSK